MNHLALRALILGSPDYAANVVTNDMPKDPDYYAKDKAIADAINSNQALMLELVNRPVNRGDFLRVLNVVVGAALFSKLKASAYEPLTYIVQELEGDGLTVSTNEEYAGFIALLQANTTLTADDIINIGKVFYEKRQITPADVSIALRNYQ